MKAYVFPGQGAQFPGMAKDLYESSEEAKRLLELANDILGFRITDIMFEGTAERIKGNEGYSTCNLPSFSSISQGF